MLVRGYALSGESVIAIVGNYDFCGWINEESCPLDMHQAIALPPSKPETPPGNDWHVHCIWDRRRWHQVLSTTGSSGFTSIGCGPANVRQRGFWHAAHAAFRGSSRVLSRRHVCRATACPW